jgi:hypothetical protein
MRYLLSVVCAAVLLFAPSYQSYAATGKQDNIAELAVTAAKKSAFGPFSETSFKHFFTRFFRIGTEGNSQKDFSVSNVFAIKDGQGFDLPWLNFYSLPKSKQIFMLSYLQNIPSGSTYEIENLPIRTVCAANFSGSESYIIFVEAAFEGLTIRKDIMAALAKKYGEDGLHQYKEINDRSANRNYGPDEEYFYFKDFDDWVIALPKFTDGGRYRGDTVVLYLNKNGVDMAQAAATEAAQRQADETQRQRQDQLKGL